jgi:hypothetical protein
VSTNINDCDTETNEKWVRAVWESSPDAPDDTQSMHEGDVCAQPDLYVRQ